eukprot:scaffold1755_cov258-Ochromonas_danica.AAC.4
MFNHMDTTQVVMPSSCLVAIKQSLLCAGMRGVTTIQHEKLENGRPAHLDILKSKFFSSTPNVWQLVNCATVFIFDDHQDQENENTLYSTCLSLEQNVRLLRTDLKAKMKAKTGNATTE